MKKDIHVAIGQRTTLTLTQAILLYSGGGKGLGDAGYACATIHEVGEGRNSAPELRPGRNPTGAELKDIFSSLIERPQQKPALFPPGLLYASENTLVWHRPARVETLWFNVPDKDGKPDKSDPLAAISGKDFPQPPLIFASHNGRLYLYAWKPGRSSVPTASTRLYVAPYWNQFEHGAICQGTMPTPKHPTPAEIPVIEKAFFQSNFTHGARKLVRPKCTHVEMWQRVKKARRFDPALLIPQPAKPGTLLDLFNILS